eukprot:6482338-Amphidinium_carterae.1
MTNKYVLATLYQKVLANNSELTRTCHPNRMHRVPLRVTGTNFQTTISCSKLHRLGLVVRVGRLIGVKR